MTLLTLSVGISSSRKKGLDSTAVLPRTCGARLCGRHGSFNRDARPTVIVRILLALTMLLPTTVWAQTSQKAIQIIVPFAPGASADGIGRILATELASRLGRPVVVENKAGAGGSLGLLSVAKAPPDGDTLTIAA